MSIEGLNLILCSWVFKRTRAHLGRSDNIEFLLLIVWLKWQHEGIFVDASVYDLESSFQGSPDFVRVAMRLNGLFPWLLSMSMVSCTVYCRLYRQCFRSSHMRFSLFGEYGCIRITAESTISPDSCSKECARLRIQKHQREFRFPSCSTVKRAEKY